MERKSLFKESYQIELSDVDFTKELKLSALFNYLQDISSKAVDNLRISIERLEQEFGVAWILTRMRVEVIRNPKWNEKITIETWPQEPKTLEFERDYIVRDLDGNPIIKAISTWIIIDINARKIRKSALIHANYPEIILERAIDTKLSKLTSYGQTKIAYEKLVSYSDTDFNGHVNNAKYIDFIMDCFTVENHKQYRVSSLEVNFINEVLPNDRLILMNDVSAIQDNHIYIEGINQRNDKVAFRAKVDIQIR